MQGLDFLHRECNIIHTDLKPENVLIGQPSPSILPPGAVLAGFGGVQVQVGAGGTVPVQATAAASPRASVSGALPSQASLASLRSALSSPTAAAGTALSSTGAATAAAAAAAAAAGAGAALEVLEARLEAGVGADGLPMSAAERKRLKKKLKKKTQKQKAKAK